MFVFSNRMNVTLGGHNRTLSPQERFARMVGTNVIVVVLCITTNSINATMVHTFNKHHVSEAAEVAEVLRRRSSGGGDEEERVTFICLLQIFRMSPRFILFIHLVVNDMIQLTISSTLFVLGASGRPLHVSVCCLFIVPAIATTQNTPLNLSLMAAECYLAVCVPLRYSSICTVVRTRLAVLLVWTASLLSVLPDVVVLHATEPLAFRRSLVFCSRDSVFRSSSSRTKRDVSHIFFLVLVWTTLFYTYFRILCVAAAADSGAKKAKNTILLHGVQMLLSMMVYVRPMIIQTTKNLFPLDLLYFFIFIINQMLPRFLSPLIYGFRDRTFWKHLKKHLCVLRRNQRDTRSKR